MIVDVEDLLRSVDLSLHQGRMRAIRVTAAATADGARRRRKRVLVVDDSITVREVERGLLDARAATSSTSPWTAWTAGTPCARGPTTSSSPTWTCRAWTASSSCAASSRTSACAAIPVMIVSYKDREEDRLRGLEAGADAYLTKSSFQEESWIGRVVDLIGEPEEEPA